MESYDCYTLINMMPGAESLSYLELGVADNYNFSRIICKDKKSVDINGKATFNMTTDNFFASLKKDIKFNLIYIDANHNFDFVLRDFNNSINHCDAWVFIHDMIPPNEMYTSPAYCSDSYKLLYHILTKENFSCYTMKHPSYMGLTMVKMPATKIIIREEPKISYQDFISYIDKHQTRLEFEEAIAVLSYL